MTSPELTQPGPAGLDRGDVDNDGDADIVASSVFTAAASVLVNNGVGKFSQRLIGSNLATADVALGKFDADANVDLVLLYPGSSPGTGLLAIFKGGGDGNFTFTGAPNAVVNTGVRPSALAVGRFDGDAIDDVAVVNSQNVPASTTGTVMTFLGNPAGNNAFAAATPAQTLTAQLGATEVVVADLDGGVDDLAVTNYASESVSLFSGNGTGFGAGSHVPAGATVFGLAAADLDGDGDRDLAASVRESSPSQVRTLFGDGAGGFPTQRTTTAAEAANGAIPQAIVASDLDGDGDRDLGVANAGPNSVSVLDNHGNGVFSPVSSSPETGIGAAGTTPFGLVSADFDGNGLNDLVASNLFTSPGELPLLLNQGGTKANLAISQSDSPDPVNAGATLTYSLTVSNAGPGTPSNVKATDTLPAGVTFNAAGSSSACSAAGGSPAAVTCDYGALAPGTPETLQVAVTVAGTASGTLANLATVAGNLADPTPANNTSSSTTTVIPDTTPPTHSLSLSGATGAVLSGSTLYYKGNSAGSFRLVDALADSGSGPASVTYPALTATGWTHAAETVSTPSGGPYTSAVHSWTAGAANPTGYSATGQDAAGNTAAAGITFASDVTAPSGGNVSYPNGTVYRTSVPVTTANGTDSQSGVNAGSGIVRRAQAPLTLSTGACGTFGAFTTTVALVGGNDTSVTSGNCYQYQYLVSDRVGNQATYSSGNVAKVDTRSYSTTVGDTTGLVNYWRLGEGEISVDNLDGTTGASLTSRSGQIGATWSAYAAGASAVFTDANRVRRGSSGLARYVTSGTPPNADYAVEADVRVNSIFFAADQAGVIGRAVAGDNYYSARLVYDGGFTNHWELQRIVNGVTTTLASVPAGAASGQTHALKLTMDGSSISMWVNGNQVASVVDSSLSAAGQAGVRLGNSFNSFVPTNTTGLHLDNFRATPLARDSKGTNDATYWNAAALGQTGAIAGSADTAVSFDGANDYVAAPRQIQDDFTIEFWFKSTQGLGTNAQWWGNAGLVDAEVNGGFWDFGTSLRSDGRVVAGIGTPDVSIVSSQSGLNDGNWHHVVFTRTRATGTLALYIDGSPAGTATGASTATLTSSAVVSLGRIATGGNYYAGTLDEVALYSTVLSQATAADHYARR